MAGEKTFAPTAARLRKARAEGNRPSAAETAGLCGTLAALVVFAQQAPGTAMALRSAWRGLLYAASAAAARGAIAAPLSPPATTLAAQAGRLVACVCATYVAVVVGVSFLLGGAGYARLRCDVGKLNAAKNAKRLFSRTNVYAAARGCAAAAGIGWLLFGGLSRSALDVAGAASPSGMILAAQGAGARILATAGGVGLLCTLVEWRTGALARLKKLRMDFSEIKREHREQNGDPYQKGRRKKMARRMQRGRRIAVRRASVVVVNPTHIAVALYYRPPEFAVPLVIAKGADFAADRIRAEARAAGVPIVTAIETARALYAQAEDGEPVPIELYGAVAPIIAALLHEGA